MTTAPQVSGKLNAVVDALNKWADDVLDGRPVEPSVTGLRLMAIAVRSAAHQDAPEPEPVSQAALQPDQNISPICQPEPQPLAKVDELAKIIRMLARHVPDDKQIKGKALDYLRRHGLQGSPLRDDATPSSAGTVSVDAAARVLLASSERGGLAVLHDEIRQSVGIRMHRG